MKYPEHEKMKEVQEDSQIIGEFLEWLKSEYELCIFREGIDNCLACEEEIDGYIPVSLKIEKILADYYDIDLDKIEKEKRQMLEEIKKGQ